MGVRPLKRREILAVKALARRAECEILFDFRVRASGQSPIRALSLARTENVATCR